MHGQLASKGLWFLNNHVSVILAQANNADRISVLEFRMPADEAPPLHVHHDEDEIFHIIEGEMRFNIGETSVTKQAGDTVLAPRGVPHGFRVISPKGVRCLIITRGGFEAMVRAASRPAPATELPAPVAPSSEMQTELAAHCAAQNIEVLGPPID